ncbi:MAG: Lrp/AsnC family transcriptional regulator [Promethearchaeota archaeon]
MQSENDYEELDEKDRQILSILQEDARIAFTKIASQMDTPDTTIHFRVRRMQEKGIIKKFTVLISPESLGLNQYAFFRLKVGGHILSDISKERAQQIAEMQQQRSEMRFVGIEEDEMTLLCLVLVHDIKELEELRNSFEKNTDITEIQMWPLTKVLKGEDYTDQVL